MKRAFLWGFASFLVICAIGSLSKYQSAFGLLGLLLALAISVPVGRAAMKAPPSKSWLHAVAGWLIGFFALDVVLLLVVLIGLGAWSLLGR